MAKVSLEELKERWLKDAPLVLMDEKRDLYLGRKPRRREDVEKLAILARHLLVSRFEVKRGKLVFKSMFDSPYAIEDR